MTLGISYTIDDEFDSKTAHIRDEKGVVCSAEQFRKGSPKFTVVAWDAKTDTPLEHTVAQAYVWLEGTNAELARLSAVEKDDGYYIGSSATEVPQKLAPIIVSGVLPPLADILQKAQPFFPNLYLELKAAQVNVYVSGSQGARVGRVLYVASHTKEVIPQLTKLLLATHVRPPDALELQEALKGSYE